MNILANFKPIKLFVLDVDGVLTDSTILLLENGEMARQMNVKDGYAMQLALKRGYEILIISGGNSISVKDRLSKLGIRNIQLSIHDKLKVLKDFTTANNYTVDQVLFMGDDMPDLLPMQHVGLACAPADAVQEIKTISQYISPFSGGKGCVRDVIEKVLKLNNHWNEDFSIASI